MTDPAELAEQLDVALQADQPRCHNAGEDAIVAYWRLVHRLAIYHPDWARALIEELADA